MRLAPVLTGFARADPQIALSVQLTDRHVNLVDEGFDLAVRVGRPADSSLVARKLCEAKVVAVASPGYLDGRGVPEGPEDLARHECIIDSNLRDPLRWPLRSGSVAVAGRLVFLDASLCLAPAEAGLGIAYMPDFVVAEALRSSRVLRILEVHAPSPCPSMP